MRDSTVGAARFEDSSWTTYTDGNAPLDESCGTVETAENEPVYFTGVDTTVKFENGNWSSVTSDVANQPLEGISSIAFGFNGQSVFGQKYQGEDDWSGGFFIYDGSNWRFMSSANDGGLFGNAIFGLSVDNDGNLWAAGYFGAAMYDGSDWSYYSESDGLALTYVRNVHAASNGTVWFGTVLGGVTYLKDGVFHVYDEYPETFFGRDIYEDSRGHIWLGYYLWDEQPGILQYDGDGFTHYHTKKGVIGETINSFAEDANGDLIVGSSEYGLARYDTATGQWSSWQSQPDRQLGDYHHFGNDPQGNVWIPGYKTLYKWDGSQLHSINMPDINSRNLEVSPDGQIWIGGDHGVKVYKDSWWYEPFSGSSVHAIAHGSNGRTYLGTRQNGLYIYNRPEVVATPNARERPERISLDKNYPNPFNPSTNIRFRLPQTSDVQLTVYNSIGQKVSTLLDRQMNAGSHTVTFDGSRLSTGMYIYRIKAGEYTESRKMLLVK